MHREGCVQYAQSGGCEVVGGQVGFARECYIGDVAGRGVFAAEAFAEIVCDDVVKARPGDSSAQLNWIIRVYNPFENFDQPEHANAQASFLEYFPHDSFLQSFPELEHATLKGPFSPQRLAAAANQ